jgi:hypothetical protein
MKSKLFALLLIGFLVLFTSVSCASSPPPPEAAASTQETTPTTPSQSLIQQVTPQDQAALNAAAARAEAARKLASDFDGASLFPQEWQSADSLYSEAERQRNAGTSAEARDSVVRYNNAADAFDALNQMIISYYYEKAERELIDAREAAIKTGAHVYTPDYLLEADGVVAEALAKYQAKDYYSAKDAFEDALLMYSILNTGLSAYKVREEIEAWGFGLYDLYGLNLADDSLYNAASDFQEKNYSSAKNKAETALFQYELALKTAWEAFAAEKAASASALRQKALDLKANVAVRQDFDAAEAIFSQANTDYRSQNFEESALLYIECESMYALAAETAREKQGEAEEALRRADQRVAESDENARNVELLVEGGV